MAVMLARGRARASVVAPPLPSGVSAATGLRRKLPACSVCCYRVDERLVRRSRSFVTPSQLLPRRASLALTERLCCADARAPEEAAGLALGSLAGSRLRGYLHNVGTRRASSDCWSAFAPGCAHSAALGPLCASARRRWFGTAAMCSAIIFVSLIGCFEARWKNRRPCSSWHWCLGRRVLEDFGGAVAWLLVARLGARSSSKLR